MPYFRSAIRIPGRASVLASGCPASAISLRCSATAPVVVSTAVITPHRSSTAR